MRITEAEVEIYSFEGEFLWELTRRLVGVHASEDLARRLRERFPRHYREQCKRLIALKQRFEQPLLRSDQTGLRSRASLRLRSLQASEGGCRALAR